MNSTRNLDAYFPFTDLLLPNKIIIKISLFTFFNTTLEEMSQLYTDAVTKRTHLTEE